MRLQDIIQMVAAGVLSPEERLHELYQWRHAINIGIARFFLAGAGAIILAFLAALLRGELETPVFQSVLLLLSAAVVAGLGLRQYRRASQLIREYAAALRFLSDMKRIEPFLRLYRDAAGR